MNIDITGALLTMRIQYEYTQKQFSGVAFEGMDIWYMGLISATVLYLSIRFYIALSS